MPLTKELQEQGMPTLEGGLPSPPMYSANMIFAAKRMKTLTSLFAIGWGELSAKP